MKIKNMKLMLLGLLAMGSVNASAAVNDEIVKDAFKYKILTQSTVEPNVGTVSLKSVDEPFADGAVVTIPETITKNVDGKDFTFTVTEIAVEAFKNSLLGEVTIAKTITSIGNAAFQGATHLKKITFPVGSQLETVGAASLATTQVSEFDFTNCTKLKSFDNQTFVGGTETQNTFIKKILLPTSTTFTTIGTALSKLPNLETLNIKDSKITSIVKNAFAGDKKLTTMELPGTVVTIADEAFSLSSVSDLTINVDAISTIGEGSKAVYGAETTPVKDTETLTKLTFKGNLKGQIKKNAFAGMAKLATLDMSGMNFITTGQIETLAFDKCVSITGVKIGNIGTSNGANYTIAEKAFQDCSKLASVEIGNISSPYAVAAKAFGEVTTADYKNVLASVKIGNIAANNIVIGDGTNAGFTFPNNLATTVQIGDIESINAATVVLPKKAFAFTATGDARYPATITIGAVKAKGNNIAAGAFDGTLVITEITFTGDIQQNGIDAAILSDNSWLQKITFKGKVGANGIGTEVFKGITNYTFGLTPIKPVITFEGLLAEGAVAEGAFKPAIATDQLFVSYSYNESDLDPNVTPFAKKTFWSDLVTSLTPRTVTLSIANEELAARVRSLQKDDAADIFYDVILIAIPQSLLVYQKDSGNTSYGRFQFTKDAFPNGLQISRHQDGVTFTLYTTYVENDEDAKIVTINMQPVPSLDGKYYIPAGELPKIFIVKATGTTGETTPMKYTDNVAGTKSNYWYPGDVDKTVRIAETQQTNEKLCAGTADDPFNNLNNPAAPKDIYFISNPANHKGILAQTWDFNTNHDVYVAVGSFYVIAPRYAGASAARIVWLDGSEETTAIKDVKNVVEDGVIYNLAGQKVDANYKGIVIKNGKKMIQK